MRSFACFAAAALVLAATPPARAQLYGVATYDAADMRLECRPVTSISDEPCPRTCPGGEECKTVGGRSFCAPRDPLFCVPEGDGGECPPSAPRERSLSGGITLCLSDTFVLCMPLELRCFLPAGGASSDVVSWRSGDCDGDGLANGGDPAPCERPARIGLVTPSGGCHEATPCVDNTSCLDPDFPMCGSVEGDRHSYCLPRGGPGVAFCCGGLAGLECPGGDACETALPDDFGFCPDPGWCKDAGWAFSRRVACLYAPDGTLTSSPDDGDCDMDGIPNRDERTGEACGGDAPSDAGAPSDDAGAPLDDAGSGADAGGGAHDAGASAMDAAAPDVPITFGGGGGCRCRAAPGGGGPPLAASAAVGALIAGRRRRSRRGAARRAR